MGRLKIALILRSITLLSFSSVAGCAGIAQNVATTTTGNLASTSVSPLVGSTPAVLNAEFGQPALLRIDGTAQVWLYHTTACGLNLILYPDASGIPRVTIASTTDGSAAPVNCATSLLQTHIDASSTSPASASAAL